MRFTRSGWVRLGALNPLGRFGLPDELAAMVAWLGGTECAFSTGTVFDLSGGGADARAHCVPPTVLEQEH